MPTDLLASDSKDLLAEDSSTIPSNSLSNNPSFLPNYNSVMDKINQRPSMIQDLIKDPSTMSRFQQHPLGTTLRSLQGGMEYLEGLPATVGMAVQSGDYKNLPDNIKSLMGGQHPAQLGDLIRTTGFGGTANEPISATTGFLASLGLNPANTKTANVVTQPGITTIDNILNPKTEDLVNKAQKLTTEILQPTKNELANATVQGKVLPAVQQAADVIKKSKNFNELGSNIDNSISTIMNQRNEILKANNFNIKNDYMKPLEQLIKDTQAGGQANESEIQQMNDVLAREKAWLTTQGGKVSRLDAQSRKEFLQNHTQSLLTKLQTGDVIDSQPARTQALNAIRGGLKDAVEGGNQKIADLNSTYGGLLRAKELIAGQHALAQKEIAQPTAISLLQKFVGLAIKPQETALDIARNNLGSLSSKTSKIEKLMNRAR